MSCAIGPAIDGYRQEVIPKVGFAITGGKQNVREAAMQNTGRIYRIQPVGSAQELAGRLVGKGLPLCRGFYHSGFLYLNDSPSVEGEIKFAVMKVDCQPAPGRHEVDQVRILSLSGSDAGEISGIIEGLRDANPLSRAVIRIDGENHCCPLCA
jgi:hypothetical protein